jgi:hypothetical protein
MARDMDEVDQLASHVSLPEGSHWRPSCEDGVWARYVDASRMLGWCVRVKWLMGQKGGGTTQAAVYSLFYFHFFLSKFKPSIQI